MATVRFVNNILDGEVKEFNVPANTTVESIIRENSTGHEYKGQIVECYDSDTGKTYFLPLEDDLPSATHTIATVNGKDAPLDYSVSENDIVFVVITPAGGSQVGKFFATNWWGKVAAGVAGGIAGVFAGGIVGAGLGLLFSGLNPIGLLIGMGIGAVVGAAGGAYLGYSLAAKMGRKYGYEQQNAKVMKMWLKQQGTDSIEGKSQPGVRGAANEPLTDNAFPVVYGKHLATPFIVGSSFNEISGTRGVDDYIHVLYAVGYAPLRLTDFKLGEQLLAHNQPWASNPNLKNIFHGVLHGCDPDAVTGDDKGDIVNTWKSNDISLEILQQSQDPTVPVDYGTIYNEATIQEDVDADVIYIASGSIISDELLPYRGQTLRNGLRTCRVQFSQQCPKSLRVELHFENGLFKTYSETYTHETYGTVSQVRYEKIPLWVAIQWRVYSKDNDSPNGEKHGVFDDSNYKNSTLRSWHSFDSVNGVAASIYDSTARSVDVNAHTGNSITATDINEGWLNAKVFNLQTFGGTREEQEGLGEFKCVTSVNLIEWARDNLSYNTEEEFVQNFKEYFLGASNTTKCVEVRVVRLSANYINETEDLDLSTFNYQKSAASFSDIFKWRTLLSTMYDEDELIANNRIVSKKPLSEKDMRKLCLVAIKARADNTYQINSSLQKMAVTAEAFNPYYDTTQHKWFPEKVEPITKYYKPNQTVGGEIIPGEEITREQFLEDRQNGIKSVQVRCGNDFTTKMVDDVIRKYTDEKDRYYIREEDLVYCENNVASVFLFNGIGPHLGFEALSYEDFNMPALGKWFDFCTNVKDGSTYNSDGYHYNHSGELVQHTKGEEVAMYFTANAYSYSPQKVEDLFSQIAVAGRAVYTRDSFNRLIPVIDKEESYPVGVINQANTLSSSYTISFEDPPSGYRINFSDESDGYNTNQVYCMRDGESKDDPKNGIEDYRFNFVTNNYQLYSLGRYVLASRILQKEVVTKKLGPEGGTIKLGNLVVLQDDTMLIGTDTGGRITSLIEDDDYIYGFLINNTYHYTGELDGNGLCKQGVIIMQPGENKESRVIKLRLAVPGTQFVVDDKIYDYNPGQVNVVVFHDRLSKNSYSQDGSIVLVYNPKVDNIVGFGEISNIAATYRVVNIKPDAKHCFEFTLAKYQPELYRYGRELPSFQNNMTTPDRSGEDSFGLSNSPTYQDLMETLSQTTGVVKTVLSSDNINTVGNPDDVTGLSAIAGREAISLSWTPVSNTGLRNSIKEYIIEKSTDSGTTWEDEASVYDSSYAYVFDRSSDGYPEYTEFSTWRFRVKAVNIYGKESEDYTECSVDSTGYGTWTVSSPSVYVRISDRTITLIMSQASRSDSREVYGTIRYKVQVRKPDTDEASVFYKPATGSDPYTSESNYKDGEGYVISDGVYVQTMPLTGQETSDIVDTLYQFRLTAFNEAGESSAVVQNAVAVCTSIRDIVKANETAKEAYISNLSAISANLGVISKGSLDGSDTNYWALSTITNEQTGVRRYEGAMRVGGTDEYLMVVPQVVDGIIQGYKIIFKVGNFEVTSEASSINGELIIQETSDSLDRTRITPTGTYYEHRGTQTSETWTAVAKQETKGLFSQILYSDKSLVVSNLSTAERRAIGHDIGKPYLSADGLVYHFDTDKNNQKGTAPYTLEYDTGNEPVLVDGETSQSESESVTDFTPAILSLAPYSEIGKSLYGQYHLTHPLSGNVWTCDFWIQYIWAENQTLFDIGNENDRISIIISQGEPNYNEPLEDEPPYNYEILEHNELCYNVTLGADNYIFHSGMGRSENIKLSDFGISFEPNSWLHFAVVMTAEKILLYIGEYESPIEFTRYSSVQTQSTAVFNPGTNEAGEINSFCLDELYIDAVAESFDSFLASSLNKIPWGSLCYTENHFILDAKDLAKVHTNLFDSDIFRQKVLEIINEYHEGDNND